MQAASRLTPNIYGHTKNPKLFQLVFYQAVDVQMFSFWYTLNTAYMDVSIHPTKNFWSLSLKEQLHEKNQKTGWPDFA